MFPDGAAMQNARLPHLARVPELVSSPTSNDIWIFDCVGMMAKIFRHMMTAALAISISSFACATAFAKGRVALVIGNDHYRSVGELNNSVNDATDVAAALKRLGFDTILATN